MQAAGGKSTQAAGVAGKSKNLKIIIKTPQSHAAGHDDAIDDGSTADDSSGELCTPLTQDQGFTSEEITMPLPRLMKLCKLQVKWAEEEGDQLRDECKQWEEVYKTEWLEKEVLLDQVVQSEQAWHERRQAVLAEQAEEADLVVAGNGEGEAAETNDDPEDPIAAET